MKDPEVTEDNMKESSKGIEVETLADTTYVNEEFNFTIEFPEDWLNHVEIDRNNFSPEQEGAVNFTYAPSDEIKQLVFAIIIIPESLEKEYEEHPFWVTIGTHNGFAFGYITPGEPIEELLEPENRDKLEYVQHMLYTDLPEIIETFLFLEN